MTDNEIIKAWEKILATGDAPIGEHWSCGGVVTTKLAKETFDMLNRQKAQIEGLQDEVVIKTDMLNEQKAEIERLQNESFCFANERDAYKDTLNTAVTEAIKEFANELIKHLGEEIAECGEVDPTTTPMAYGTVLGLRAAIGYAEAVVMLGSSEESAKEMVGDDNA